ncbi:MFS transporter [Streptomyces sp. CA-294286]|uniref:MFS transporter n=1 Tax=Streptomyces sp. CA-294286 TaxID=3240070 RepID=UPI003D8FA751
MLKRHRGEPVGAVRQLRERVGAVRHRTERFGAVRQLGERSAAVRHLSERSAAVRYLTGATAARTGDDMSGPAVLLLALAVTGSTAAASSLLAGLTIAAAAGGPVFGVLLDRTRRPGRLLAVALGLYAAALLVVLLLLGRAPVPVVVLVAVGAGLFGPALSAGWTSQLPLVVEEEGLGRANALDASTLSVAGLVGPALAGGVAGLAGASASVAVSATLILTALPVAWTLPGSRTAVPGSRPAAGERVRAEDGRAAETRTEDGHVTKSRTKDGRAAATHVEDAHTPAPPLEDARAPAALAGSAHAPALPVENARTEGTPGRPVPARSVLVDLADGFRAVGRSRPLARATAASVLSCTGEGVFVTVAPLLGAVALGGAHHGALMLSGTALGALAANAVLAGRPRLVRRPDLVIAPSALVVGVACLLAATLHPVAVIAAGVLAGIGAGPQLTALFAVRHRESPPLLRGRVFTTGASLKLTGFALGAALAGPLATRSVPVALLVAAGFQGAAAACGARVRIRLGRAVRLSSSVDHGRKQRSRS